ncbi:MAG: hypothetical protein WEB62_04330 [Bacteroidota bacterium]
MRKVETMKTTLSYRRRISTQEAREGYIFVLKNRLSFFPHPGKPLILDGGTQNRTGTVESYACTCQGPDLPHDHFFIRWSGLRRGDLLVFRKVEGKEGSYHVEVSH